MAGKAKKREITPLKIHTERRREGERIVLPGMTFRELCASASSVISVYTLLHACVLALLGPQIIYGVGL
jgi:hypothetical protein